MKKHFSCDNNKYKTNGIVNPKWILLVISCDNLAALDFFCLLVEMRILCRKIRNTRTADKQIGFVCIRNTCHTHKYDIRFRRWWKMHSSATAFYIFECVSSTRIDTRNRLRQILYFIFVTRLKKKRTCICFILRVTPGDAIARICMNSPICCSLLFVLACVNYKWDARFRLSSELYLEWFHRYFDIHGEWSNIRSFSSFRRL